MSSSTVPYLNLSDLEAEDKENTDLPYNFYPGTFPKRDLALWNDTFGPDDEGPPPAADIPDRISACLRLGSVDPPLPIQGAAFDFLPSPCDPKANDSDSDSDSGGLVASASDSDSPPLVPRAMTMAYLHADNGDPDRHAELILEKQRFESKLEEYALTCPQCAHEENKHCYHVRPKDPKIPCDICPSLAAFSIRPPRCDRHWFMLDPCDDSKCPSCGDVECRVRCHMLNGETGYSTSEWIHEWCWKSPAALGCCRTCIAYPCHPFNCFYSSRVRYLLLHAYERGYLPFIPAWLINFDGLLDIPLAVRSFTLNKPFAVGLPCANEHHTVYDSGNNHELLTGGLRPATVAVVPDVVVAAEYTRSFFNPIFGDDAYNIINDYLVDDFIYNCFGSHCDFCLRVGEGVAVMYHPKDNLFSVHCLRSKYPDNHCFGDKNRIVPIKVDDAVNTEQRSCLAHHRFYRGLTVISGRECFLDSPSSWTTLIGHSQVPSVRLNGHGSSHAWHVHTARRLVSGDELTLNFAWPCCVRDVASGVMKVATLFEADYMELEAMFKRSPRHFFERIEMRVRALASLRAAQHAKKFPDVPPPPPPPRLLGCALPPLLKPRRKRPNGTDLDTRPVVFKPPARRHQVLYALDSLFIVIVLGRPQAF